jgi:hypothetical protein
MENDMEAEHVMQHPIHFHGQRFLILATNGISNLNMAWKDTVLVAPGEVVDVLIDMSNLGEWMSHCHIAEHLHAGMMLKFRVEDNNGYATGDEYRDSLPAGASMHVGDTVAASDGHTDHEHDDAPAEQDEHFVGDGHTDHTHEPAFGGGAWWESQRWWTLFFISLGLILILSVGVFKFVNRE